MNTARSGRRLAIGILSLLILGSAHGAGSAGAQIAVATHFIVNPVEGNSLNACSASAEVERSKAAFRFDFARVAPQTEGGWEAAALDVDCGSAIHGGASDDGGDPPAVPYLIGTVATTAGFLPENLTPDRVLLVDVVLTLRRFAGFDAAGRPEYEQLPEVRRRFHLLDTREVLVPVLVTGDAERKALGVRELLLRLDLTTEAGNTGAAYGRIAILSRSAESEVLLDGSVVGKTPESGELILRNVPAGMHLVRVRTSSRKESGSVVRVVPDRTVVVDPGAGAGRSRPFELEPLGKNDHGYDEFRRGADGAVVVRIPAGEFLMGNKDTERSPLEHRVYVSDFLIDKTGVTWEQYKKFAASTGTPLPPHDPYWGIHNDHPAVYVTWEEAKAYCEWAGGRLPTEAEREKAARGTDDRKFPWGNEEPTPELGVFRHEWGNEATEAVGTHAAGVSPYGLHDMGGNVWEWCADWYSDDYFAHSPHDDPKGPATGSAHVVRGGSWDSRPTVLSSSCRNWGYRGYREGDFGFRCAMNAPQPPEAP